MRDAFEACIRAGGLAVFPSDTVYGIACDASSDAAVDRLYALKGRPPRKPSAVMWFSLDAALAALPALGPRTRAALGALLPGQVGFLVPNPDHLFPLACGDDPGTLGVRVPAVPGLAGASVAVLQSSANLSGGVDARTVDEIPAEIRDGVDLVLDGDELPGTPSTLVDLRRFEDTATWTVIRHGAVSEAVLQEILG